MKLSRFPSLNKHRSVRSSCRVSFLGSIGFDVIVVFRHQQVRALSRRSIYHEQRAKMISKKVAQAQRILRPILAQSAKLRQSPASQFLNQSLQIDESKFDIINIDKCAKRLARLRKFNKPCSIELNRLCFVMHYRITEKPR
jgi:hypothetical protein